MKRNFLLLFMKVLWELVLRLILDPILIKSIWIQKVYKNLLSSTGMMLIKKKDWKEVMMKVNFLLKCKKKSSKISLISKQLSNYNRSFFFRAVKSLLWLLECYQLKIRNLFQASLIGDFLLKLLLSIIIKSLKK